MKREPRWLSRSFLLATHDRLLAEHGGAKGVRDSGALESVLAAPRNLAAYGSADLFDFAAAYAHALVRLHPFVDGNKRVALVAAGVFLEWNDVRFAAGEADAVAAVLALVTKAMGAPDFANWLRVSCRAAPARAVKGTKKTTPRARRQPAKSRRRKR